MPREDSAPAIAHHPHRDTPHRVEPRPSGVHPTTRRRSRFAPFTALVLVASVLASSLTSSGAAADERLAPIVHADDPTLPDFEPFEAPTRMASPTLVVIGATLMGVGTAGLVTGAVMTARADENPGAPDFVSGPTMVLGGVLLAAGLPFLAIGARSVPVGESASVAPDVRVGAGAADLTWRF